MLRDLAQKARDAGLLNPEAIETMLRENLRRRGIDELFQGMERIAAVGNQPIMHHIKITSKNRLYLFVDSVDGAPIAALKKYIEQQQSPA